MDILFDPDLVVARRKRAAKSFEPKAGFLMDLAAEELAFRLHAVERHFDHAAEMFGGTGSVATAAMMTGKIGELKRVDVAGNADIEAGSFEDVPLEPASLNLVLAPLSLHVVNDLPGSLIRIRRALKPDGLFLAAIPGSGTLSELNEVLLETETRLYGGASPRVIPFGDVRSIGALLQRAGFALPVADVETYTVRYESLFGLMKDLRAFGMTNMLADRSRRPVSRQFFIEAAKLYAERYADPDGRIRATFSITYLSGWAPHESQAKPLKPGSATVRLADALKDPKG
ncbi:methyltransferase domain-containing protein [Rhizobium sp. TH2]|uniref:methyltransferase domain-containing protein n=1 Tax=Rhizobium sp. TH2 TaxID=2775403 RepID=UPI0021582894|nr:methyltransferase domain-containing protein [Rhizobium sp. TH2]UVC08310.1 methyltransferase domain-containing protein [Rhizobium sp. TH2]